MRWRPVMSQAVRHPAWRPPPRAPASAVPSHQDDTPHEPLALGVHFHVVARESGRERRDIPIFQSAPGQIKWEGGGNGRADRADVPGVPGAFLLRDVLTPRECEALIRMSEAMGYTEDAPVSLARDVRHNQNCVWIADDSLLGPIFERCRHLLPVNKERGAAVGLNARWRLYKYGPNDIFRPHTDGSWPGSGITQQGKLEFDIYGDRWSMLTCVLYLNDDFEGGETTFFLPENQGGGDSGRVGAHPVAAQQGSALCFYHGEHEQSPLHEGSLIHKGTKYIIRTDLLYMLPCK